MQALIEKVFQDAQDTRKAEGTARAETMGRRIELRGGVGGQSTSEWLTLPTNQGVFITTMVFGRSGLRFGVQVRSSGMECLMRFEKGNRCCCDETKCLPCTDCPREGETITLELEPGKPGVKLRTNERTYYTLMETCTVGNGKDFRLVMRRDGDIRHTSGVPNRRTVVTLMSHEDRNIALGLRRGASLTFRGMSGQITSSCFRRHKCLGGLVCCGHKCFHVCKNCPAAHTPRGGYCMCYPLGYLSAGMHVSKSGSCLLPAGEQGESVPSVDLYQPKHLRSKTMHAYDDKF